ncbi:LysR family transcriptional regulator [Yoonia sp. GPGPB17]|uniref:LysR family transcriptional regulator n=1 Tax=Yoonia sp. GPGPB17 TaxID=3026147 RepID=UPI0030C137D1
MRNVRNTDLNLLVVFDAVMAERSVTKAGERIGLAQPSMSNALSRLRALFDDDLFVRTPRGMMPTQVALDAADHVRAAIIAAEDAISVATAFDPRTHEGKITLLTSDLMELTVVPDIVRALRNLAAGIRLKTLGLVRGQIADELDAGHADVALSPISNTPTRFHHQVLCEEPFAGIARFDHPILDGPVTLDSFLAHKHALLSHRSDGKGIIDEVLASKGLTRDVAVSVSNFATLPPLVVETNVIAVLPRRLAAKADKELPVTMLELPFEVPTVQSKLIWGRSADRSAIQTWFRRLVADIVVGDGSERRL